MEPSALSLEQCFFLGVTANLGKRNSADDSICVWTTTGTRIYQVMDLEMLVTDTYVKMPSYRKINAIPESSCPAGSHRSKSCNCHNRGKESGRFSVHWTYALNICFEHLLRTFASDICFEHNFPDCVSCNSLNLIQYCYGYGHRTTEFLLDFF